MRSGRLTRKLGLVVAATLVATVTGCSGSGSDGETTPAACTSPGVSADQVNLGVVYSDSGAGSSALSASRAGIEARLGLANDQGGVNGRRLTYNWADDASNPAGNARATRELLDKGIFGLLTVTGALSGSLEILAKDRVPVSGLIQGDWGSYDNLFSFMYDASPVTTAKYIHASGGRKAAFLMSGSAEFTRTVATEYRAAFEGAGLPSSSEIISYAAGTDSPVQVAQRLAATGADSLVAFTAPSDLAAVMQAARGTGLQLASVVSTTGYDHSTLREFGAALTGVSFSVNFRPFEAGGEPIQRYQAAMSRFAPETADPEQQFAMYGYVYADLFIRGLELAGPCPTREGFISALRAVPSYDAGGLVEPVQLANIANQPLPCNAFVRIVPDGSAFEVSNGRVCVDGSGT